MAPYDAAPSAGTPIAFPVTKEAPHAPLGGTAVREVGRTPMLWNEAHTVARAAVAGEAIVRAFRERDFTRHEARSRARDRARHE